MESAILEFLGPWAWVALGLVLLGAEILLPSTILLWPALAALIVGVATLLLGLENPVWPWQTQVITFLILSLVIAYLGRGYMSRQRENSDETPALNERGAQLIGRTATLDQPVSNGSGRIRMGDSTWRVTGPDIPAGNTVRVIGIDGSTLRVEAVEAHADS